jgi:hypothetical protein
MARQYGTPASPFAQGTKYGDQPGDRNDPEPKASPSDSSPSNGAVTAFHKNASVDTRAEDVHHTLGSDHNQAAPGDHQHKGGDSVALFAGITITGARGGNSAVASIIALLTQFGAKDSTTA